MYILEMYDIYPLRYLRNFYNFGDVYFLNICVILVFYRFNKNKVLRKGRSVNCYKCERNGHRAFECKSKEIVCYNCGEVGHISMKVRKNTRRGD